MSWRAAARPYASLPATSHWSPAALLHLAFPRNPPGKVVHTDERRSRAHAVGVGPSMHKVVQPPWRDSGFPHDLRHGCTAAPEPKHEPFGCRRYRPRLRLRNKLAPALFAG